jgi:hypothetical protein
VFVVIFFISGLFFGIEVAIVVSTIFSLLIVGEFWRLTGEKPPKYNTITELVEIGRSKSCIACKQAVEHLK